MSEPAKRRPNLVLILGLGLAIATVATIGLSVYSRIQEKTATVPIEFRDYALVKPFEFVDHNGSTYGSEDLDGKIWLATFIFTSCGVECPIVSLRMSQLHRRFEDNPDVKFVSVTVDPQTDTPERLAKYAKRYWAQDNWRFLTGDADQINQMVKESFLLPVAETPEEESKIKAASFIHSDKIAVVDRSGMVRFFAKGTLEKNVDVLERAVNRLLGAPSV